MLSPCRRIPTDRSSRTDDAGNWVAVWSTYNFRDESGTDADILVARSADYGATWTAPAPLNTNAASDWGVDLWPQVATNKAGNWVAVWHCYGSRGGKTGTDADILVARSNDNGATWTNCWLTGLAQCLHSHASFVAIGVLVSVANTSIAIFPRIVSSR